MSDSLSGTAHLVVVTDEGLSPRVAQIKARWEFLGEDIAEVAKRAKMSAKQLGRILAGKVADPRDTTLRKIERALDELAAEQGVRGGEGFSTGEGQVTIVAEGVFGIQRITVAGTPDDAEGTMARLIEDIRRRLPEDGEST